MGLVRIRVLGIGSTTPFEEDRWVESYDPEGHDGRGDAILTGSRDRALVLPVADALDLYRAVPAARPTRPDGKPNRPLSAFTVEFEPVAP